MEPQPAYRFPAPLGYPGFAFHAERAQRENDSLVLSLAASPYAIITHTREKSGLGTYAAMGHSLGLVGLLGTVVRGRQSCTGFVRFVPGIRFLGKNVLNHRGGSQHLLKIWTPQ